jgi:peptide/nickel transport system substrate-binding protein
MYNSFSSVWKVKARAATPFLSLLVIFSIVLAACGGSGSTSGQKHTTLTVINSATGSWQQNFNPYSSTAFNQPGSQGMIYETMLFISDLDGKETPWLAQSYNFSSDVKTLTFHLRPNVLWSDGKPFTSADVLFTLNMLKQYPALDTVLAISRQSVTCQPGPLNHFLSHTSRSSSPTRSALGHHTCKRCPRN